MLELTWTPDAKPPTLVPGSKWRSRKTQLECQLIVVGDAWSICYNGQALPNIDGYKSSTHGDMLAWLARDFEPLDVPQDNRTVGELEDGEWFVFRSRILEAGESCNEFARWCWRIGTGISEDVPCDYRPTRILGRINPDSIAAILREAGGGA